MAPRGTWSKVRDRGTWIGRRDAGRTYLKHAQNALDLAEARDDGRVIVHEAVLSAIAFGDALTIRVGGIRNGKDHQRLVDVVLYALGNRAPQAELQRLSRLLRLKDDSAYGHRPMSLDEARAALEKADTFASWAELELARG